MGHWAQCEEELKVDHEEGAGSIRGARESEKPDRHDDSPCGTPDELFALFR